MNKNKNKMKKRRIENGRTKEGTVNEVGVEGASKISESLKVNTTLTKLYLYGDE